MKGLPRADNPFHVILRSPRQCIRIKAQHRLAFRLAQLGNAFEPAADRARARADQLVQLAAGLVKPVLGLRQAGSNLSNSVLTAPSTLHTSPDRF